MEIDEVINMIKKYVKERTYERTGSNWWYINRILKEALLINKVEEEKGDNNVISIIVLFHNIYDWDNETCKNIKDRITDIMFKLKLENYIVKKDFDKILESVDSIKNNIASSDEMCLECKIVKDAIYLDKLGAIGIAKGFAKENYLGKQIYNPDNYYSDVLNIKSTIESNIDSITTFYKELKNFDEMIYTKIAKKVAQKRLNFVEEFLKHFYSEWNMEDFYDDPL